MGAVAVALAEPLDLSQADLAGLAEFLASDRAPPGAMSIFQLDGFLTGIAISPDLILPSEWLPHVWSESQAPVFADLGVAKTQTAAITALYNEIVQSIREQNPEPLHYVDPDGRIDASPWVYGFGQAMALRMKTWERLARSRDGSMLLIPLMMLSGDLGGEDLLDLQPGEEREEAVAKFAAMLPLAILAIDRYWHSAKANTAGRNAPCPCGSGKKYKKCCGA